MKGFSGSNETASIILLLIVGTWFFTSSRFQAFKTVLLSKVAETKTILDSPYISKEDKELSQGQSGIIGVTPDGRVPALLVPKLDPSKLG
jgi:hypothetical protein